jgi:uncharacterized protein (TIGR03382 family)
VIGGGIALLLGLGLATPALAGGDADTDTDTDSDTDTDTDTDTSTGSANNAATVADEAGGIACGCASAEPLAAWALLPALVVVRRRR